MMLAPDQPLINVLLIAVGLYLLIKGSGWFVDSAVFIARKFEVSEMIIGLTLVSIGTSLPELAANVYASATGQAGVSLGNVVGSNITNITLIMGIGAVYAKVIPIPKSLLGRDGLTLISVYFIFIYLCRFDGIRPDNFLSVYKGIVLLIIFIFYLYLLIKDREILSDELKEEHHDEFIKSVSSALLFFIIGFVMITFGAKLAVDNVVCIANRLNISKEIISGTIIAFGTSVPELAVTVVSINRGKHNLALGNIIGSCIFNIILVMGVAVVIQPLYVSDEMNNVFLPLMLFSGGLLIVFMRIGMKLVRWQGVVLTSIYFFYLVYNIRQVLFAGKS
jgi:cation:H+ antiporter